MLELSPEVETTVRDYGSREGVSVEELIARAFPPSQPLPLVETSAQVDLRVKALLAKLQAQAGMPRPGASSRSLAELTVEWAAEDANITEAERLAEREFWADY